MTDEQIVQFITHRAQISGQPLQLRNPRLVIYRNNSSILFLGVKFENYTDTFLVRFTNGTQRGVFKIKPQDPSFEPWRQQFCKEHGAIFNADYDLSKLPPCVKHYISFAIIEALKTNGMGFDLFSFSFKDDLEIIRPSESYEEATIETDLADFNFDFSLGLTELPTL